MIFEMEPGRWIMNPQPGDGQKIRRALDNGRHMIREISCDGYEVKYPVPEAFPFVDGPTLKTMMFLLPATKYLDEPDPRQWDIVARALKLRFFRCEDVFYENLGKPLLLRLRRMLTENGIKADTEPSHETDVRTRRPPFWIGSELFLEAYPDMRTLEFSDADRYAIRSSWNPLIPYMTENELEKFVHMIYKKSYLYDDTIKLLASKMDDGTFVAPEFFIRNVYTGCAARGRQYLIREKPSLARFMLKSDFMDLLDVKGVLQYALDQGWVTRFNHDSVYAALKEDEDRAVLLKWDEEHGMQQQMEKLSETRRNSDAFSTSSMRRDWSVFHGEDGVHLSLRSNLSSDVLCIPAKVAGKPVVSLEHMDHLKDKELPGGFAWYSVRKIVLDSAFGDRMADEGSGLKHSIVKFLRSFPRFQNKQTRGYNREDPLVVETFGEGSLRVVPGALLAGNEIIEALPSDELVLPEGVTEIPAEMFSSSPVRKASLPDSLRIIGNAAFMGSAIEEADIPCQVGDHAFESCSQLRRVRINGNIGYAAFQLCRDLSELELGPGVRKIEPFSFSMGYHEKEGQDRGRLPKVSAFRATVYTSAFFGRTLASASFTGCRFESSTESEYSDILEVLDLTLSRCTGRIPTARPPKNRKGSISISGGEMRGNFSAYSGLPATDQAEAS